MGEKIVILHSVSRKTRILRLAVATGGHSHRQ